jgi:hypothetical protein
MNRFAMRRWLFVFVIFSATPLFATSFTSTQSGNWSSAATWGGGGVPGSSDSATVSGGNTVTLDVPVTVSSVTLGGTLTGTQSLTVTSAFNWSGGTNSGAGTTTIQSGATMNVSNYGYLDGRTLNNAGTIAFPSGYYLTLQNNAVLANSGTVDFQGDGSIYLSGTLGTTSISNSGTIKKSGGTGVSSLYTLPIAAQSGSQLLVQSGTLYLGAVTSSGATFDVSSGATMTFYSNDTRTFDGASTISGAGTVQWNSGTSSVNANYNVTGTTLNSATTTIGSITSIGNVTVTGGTLTLNGASAINIPILTMQGGTLSGSAPINLTGSTMTWTGGVIAGTGALSIPGSTTLTLSGYLYFDTRPVSNAGIINYTSSYYAYMQNGAALTNSGTIDFQGDSGIYLNTGSATITNSGTIKKSAGTSIGGLSVALLAQSGSQVQVQSGTFYLAAVTSTGATFTVASGTTLSAVYNNTRTFDAASTISGAGTMSWGSGTNTVNAAYNVTGATTNTATTVINTITSVGNVSVSGGALTLNNVAGIGSIGVAGGTLTLNSASALSVPTLTMQGGTLNGTSSINLTGSAMTWTGGVIAGSGALSIPGGTTITISGYLYFDTRAIGNAGIINFTSYYYTSMQNGATLTNSGTIDFQGDSAIYVSGSVGTLSITSSGTIKKSGGTAASTINVPLIAQSGSQFNVLTGAGTSFNLGAVAGTGATFTVASGAALSFNTNDTRTFDAATGIGGAGFVAWGSGTNTVNATYNVTGGTGSGGGVTTLGGTISNTGALNVSGGTLTLNNPANTIGAVTVNGGTLTLNNASTLSVPTLTMGGGTLNGSASINVTATTPVTWSGGTIGGNSGTTLTIPATTITVSGYPTIDARAITSAATINLTSTYYFYMVNSASLLNNGTIDFQGDGAIYVSGAGGTITNSSTGIIKKSAGSTGAYIQVPLTMQSGSQLNIGASTGTFGLGPVTATGATFTVPTGATLNFYYTGTRTFDATSSISGAGTVVWYQGTNTVSGTYDITGATQSLAATTSIATVTNTGTVTSSGGTLTLNNVPATAVGALTVNGGALTLNSGVTLSVPTLTMVGGTLNGSASISITSTTPVTWSGGTISGNSGTTLAIPAATITVSGYPYIDTRAVTSSATINITSTYYVSMSNNATLLNNGTIDFQGDGAIYVSGPVGTLSITNSGTGTIKKSGGTGASAINVPLIAQSSSQFSVLTGTGTSFNIGAVTSTGATFTVASGATLNFNTNDTRTFDAATGISGAGTVLWGSGANTVNATYNVTGATGSIGGATTIGTISNTGALNVSGGALTLNNPANTVGAVTVNGGTLTLNNASTLNVPTLTMGGGTLNGSASINVTSTTPVTWSGGTIGGNSGTTLTLPATTITVSGYPTIDTRAVTSAATINITSTHSFYMANNATLLNNGTIDFQGDGGFYVSGAGGTITNGATTGIIKKSAGSTGAYIQVPLTMQSGSQLNIGANTGTFGLGPVTSTGATFNVPTGATLNFYYTGTRTFDASSSISGAGTVIWYQGTNTVSGTYNITGATQSIAATTTIGSPITSVGALTVTGGTLTLNNASTLSIPTLTMQGGTLNGSASINLTGAAMTWSGGTISGNSGTTLSIPATTTITITAGYPYLDTRTFTNAGTIAITSTYYSQMQNGATLNNSGTIDFQSDGAIYLGAGTASITNSNIIKKSNGTSSGSTISVPLTMQSGSQFNVTTGTFYLADVTSTGATFSVSTGTTLNFYYNNTRTFDAASIISGAGTTQWQSGTNTFSGTISTPMGVSGGTLTLNGAATQSIPTLTLSGGTLNGSASVNLTGAAMTWTGGTLGGSGTLSIPATTTITISGYPYFDARTVNNAGTIKMTSTYYAYMQNGAALTNSGTIDFQGDGSIYIYTGAATITNNGLLVKSGGTGTSYLTVPVTNAASGTVKPVSGTLSFSSLAQSGTLSFPIASATAFGKVSVTGAFALGGALTVATTGGYVPPNGTSFPILTYGSYSGAFAAKNLDYPTGTFVENYAPTSLTVSAGPQALALSSVTPSRGPAAGGTSVNLSGSNFVATTAVTFGGVSAASVVFNNSTSLTVVTPAHVAGPVDVVVSNPSTQTATLSNGFTYVGLVSYYSFDVANNPGKDVAGSNDAISTIGVTEVSGRVASAGSFIGGYMDLPPAASLNLRSADFTLDAFVNSSSTTNGNWFTKAAPGPAHQYGLGTANSTKALFSFDGGAGGIVTSFSDIFDGTWHHVAAVKRGSVAEIWIDGRLEVASSVSGTSDLGAFAIGRNGSCCESFNGLIDEARIYNYALSQAEIRTDALVTDLAITKSAPPSVTMGQNISYGITVTNNGPITATAVTVTDILPAGTSFISATPSQGTCSGTTTVTCTLGTMTNGANATVTIVVAATTAGSITNTATVSGNQSDPNTADNTSSATTIVNTLTCATPTITAGGPTTFCAGGSVTLTANAANPSAFQWYRNSVAIGGATASTYTASVTGSYTVKVTYPNSCAATSAVTSVTVNPTPPTPAITASGPTTFCTGGSVTLAAPAGYTYAWSTGATTQSITVTTAGSYSVTVTDGNGCSATSAPTTVNVASNPTVTITGPATSCAGATITLDAGPGFASYAWSTGEVTQTISAAPVSTTTYSVTVTNGANCSGSASKTVTVSATPAPTITAPASVCANSSGNTASTGTVAGAMYVWTITNGTITAGAGTSSITFSAGSSGNVQLGVTVTGSTGCSASASKILGVASTGTVSINAPSSVAPNTSGNMASVPAGPAGTTYAWTIAGGTITAGQGTQAITWTSGNSTITINVTVTNGTCSSTGSATVPISSSADLSVSVSAPPSVNSGDPIVYLVTVSNAGPNAAQGVLVVDNLPAGVAFNSATGSGWTCNGSGGGVSCSAQSVAVGTSSPITINATAPSGAGMIVNSVTVGASTNDPNSANNHATATTQVSAPPAQCGSTPPALIAPASGASSLANPIAFSWSGVANAQSYDLWVGAGGATPSIATTTASTSASLSLPAGAATWFVVARFGNGCSSLTSETRNFTVAQTTNCAHDAPQLVAPAPGAVVSSPVVFQWTTAAGAGNYRLWVAVDGGAPQDVGLSNGANNLSVSLTGTSFSWFVEALFNGCPSTRSASSTFTIPAADPCANRGTSTLIAPADKSTVGSSSVPFKWSAVANANGYRVWAAVNGGDFNALGTTTSDTTLTATIASGSVEWYVQTLFDGCAGTESAHFTFTVPQAMTCPTNPAMIASPSAGATLTSTSVPFSWTAVPNAIGYEVWLSFNNAAASLLGTTTSSTSLTHDVPAGALEWFVRTSFNGCPPLDSAHAAFTVSPPPICQTQRPLLTKPADDDQVVSPVDLQWSAVPQATQYDVWIARDHGAPMLLGATGQLHLDAQVLQPGSYDWYVDAAFSHGCPSTQSAGGSFTVVQPPPPCAPPTVPMPRADSQVSSNVQYTIAWNRIGNAAFYEYQEAGTSDFAGVSPTSTSADHVNFQHTNSALTPITFFFRVRMVSQCDGTRSLFSPTVAVAILPTQTTNTSQVNGATPADAPQIVTYTLTLGGSAPGSIPAQPGQTFSVVPNQPWISVMPSNGTVTADGVTLTVTADTTGLPLGTSTGAVTIVFGASSGRYSVKDSTSLTTTVSVNLVQPVTSTTKSAPPPDALIIPAVAHADGINSKFQSDIRVTNTAPQVQKYQITFTPSGDAGSKAGQQASVSIDPGATLALDDILNTWFGAGTGAQGTIGMLEIRPLTTTSSTTSVAPATGIPSINTFASSRTYNTTANGTLGQFIPAIPFAQFIGALNSSGKTSVLTLQQIAQSDAFRTNVGLVEGSGNPATVLLSIFGDSGSKLAELSQALTGGQHLQLNSLLAAHNLSVNDGRIEVRVTSAGGKVTAYASVVDNATNDPLLVSPVQVSSLGSTKWVVPGIADLNNGLANWRSDVRIYNAGSTAVNTTLTYVAQGATAPQTTTLTIAPNEVKQLDGILQSLFGVTNSGGALHVATSNSAALVVTARTYNQTSNGTYGQFIPAVTPNDAAGKGQRALQILQVEESDRYRSNVGLAEVSGKPATVEITAVPADAKFSVRAQITLAANEFRQYGSLLRSLGLSDTYNARVTIRVVDGDGKVTAYASVVDQRTQVPTFVPAQ